MNVAGIIFLSVWLEMNCRGWKPAAGLLGTGWVLVLSHVSVSVPHLHPPPPSSAAMLKPGDPSGSAFLKVDPSYLQHWQQLFPQAQLKAPPPPPPDRLSIAMDTLRPSRLHTHLLASTHCTSSSSSTSSSAAPSSAAAALTPSSSVSISTSAGLSQLPVPQQIALFGQALAPVCAGPVGAAGATGGGGAGDLVVVVPPENQHGHNPAAELLHQAKEQRCGGVGVVSSSVKSSSVVGGGEEGGKAAGGRFKLTSEELDYYLYGQQRMEIIPLSNHTGELNNRTSKHTHTVTFNLSRFTPPASTFICYLHKTSCSISVKI